MRKLPQNKGMIQMIALLLANIKIVMVILLVGSIAGLAHVYGSPIADARR
jgi:hypothetical protein